MGENIDIKMLLENYKYNVLEVQRIDNESKNINSLELKLENFKHQESKKKLSQLNSKILDDSKRKVSELKRASELINSIPEENLKEILHLRYIECNKWDDIATQMNYDIDAKSIFRLHRTAMKRLENVAKINNKSNNA